MVYPFTKDKTLAGQIRHSTGFAEYPLRYPLLAIAAQ
jgi:hypothetical protein